MKFRAILGAAALLSTVGVSAAFAGFFNVPPPIPEFDGSSSIAVIATTSHVHHLSVASIGIPASRHVTIRLTAVGGVNWPMATLMVMTMPSQTRSQWYACATGSRKGRKNCGSSVKTGRLAEIIQAKAKKEAGKGQRRPRKTKWQPEDKKKIEIRRDKPVQRRHLEKNEYLHQDKQDKTDDIFQQLTHWFFLRVESSSLFCSSY